MKLLSIYFDGGCSPNPGSKYGSYEVQLNGRTVLSQQRFQLGHGTNNEAEFEALRLALEAVAQRLHEEQLPLSEHQVKIETDSKIVLNRLTKKNKVHQKPTWRESSERMFNLAESCLVYLRRFASFEVRWRGRENNVARFGH